VMITLLAVGEAVLVQARDKNLVGGGDLVLVPLGIDIESLKVGGVSAMYYSIPEARFIVHQMLSSSRFQNEIEMISPYLYSEVLYARKKMAGTEARAPELGVETIFAEGSIPEFEQTIKRWKLPWKNNDADQDWIQPPDLNNIDRFHLPSSADLPLDQWAEWHYFNFDAKEFFGYFSIMAAGDVLHDRGTWIVSLQLFDGNYKRYFQTYPATRDQLPLKRVDYVIGPNQIKLVNNVYEIDLNFDKVRGKLRYTPTPNLYCPPVMLAESEGFESGYVIPSVKGVFEGSLSIDGRKYDFTNAAGYHDHNWGIWQQPQSSGDPVRWNWGHAFSDSHALFYGEIFLKNRSRGLFVVVFDNKGYLTIFRPGSIQYSDYALQPEAISVPKRLHVSERKAFTAIEMDGTSKSFAATLMQSKNPLYFIQYKMDYIIKLEIDGKSVTFPASGNSETFVNR
ncbi:MAG TPA: hypothetical protein VH815_09730, partial [Acidobacteriota bacterium]